MVPEDVVAE